jgi:ornithine--oxo-acid transaminase
VLYNLKRLLITNFINKVRISPPLIISNKEIERAMGILREALEEVGEYKDVPRMV